MAKSKRRSVVVRGLVFAFVLGLLGWVIRGIVADASRVEWDDLVQRPELIVMACGLWLTAFLFRAWLWGEMMRRSGYSVPHAGSARVFLASHLGRFLPGKVWSVVGAGIFGRRLGVPGSACAVSMTVFLIIYYMVGSLVALLVIWRVSQAHVWTAVALGAAGVLLLAFLASPLFPRLLAWVGHKSGRSLEHLKLPSPLMLIVVTLGLAGVWLTAGGAFCLMIRAIAAPHMAPIAYVDALGTYASALVAGFAVLFAPAGLGVRESVMSTLLSPAYGAAYAGIFALASRVIITSIEMVLSTWGILPHLRELKEVRTRVAEGKPTVGDSAAGEPH